MQKTEIIYSNFHKFSAHLAQLGESGIGNSIFTLGTESRYQLQYIPFEHINRDARLVVVGITPGMNQLRLAYEAAKVGLNADWGIEKTLKYIKQQGAFGGSAMRPNLLKMLRHFDFEHLLEIGDVTSLWGSNSHLLQTTSVVPHAAFKAGKMFAGSFGEVMRSRLLRECFEESFVPTLAELSPDAMYVGLGPCPLDALKWCADRGLIKRSQLLGAFCHPSGSGGSMTRYFLREVAKSDLKPKDPVRSRCNWLDEAYQMMSLNISQRLAA